MSTAARLISSWIRDHVTLADARGLVVGLSGGVDSAVVARLCQMAMPETTLCAILPCHSDTLDELDARLVADHFKLPTTRIDLQWTHDVLIGALEPALAPHPGEQAVSASAAGKRISKPLANVKPRLRMTALYYIANKLNFLVAGTGNRSEITVGYFTKYGDGGADLLPIGHLLKGQVVALARDLEVPAAVTDKAPSAGLWTGQTDEAEMGFSYQDLETYLTEGSETIAPATALRIERCMRSSEHKRQGPPIPDF